MAKHLDLEEQEQLAELKHFWKQYGKPIVSVAVAVIFAVVGRWGYQYRQTDQAMQASSLYDQVDRAVAAGDLARIERSLADMKDKFAGTVYADHAALLVAKTQYEKGNLDASKAALNWVTDKGKDPALQSVAKLRLSAMLLETKAYDEALKAISGTFTKDFAALANDRRGDILLAQGKKTEARTEYENAFKGLDDRVEYRRLVEVKLNALGVDPVAITTGATKTTDSEAKK